MRATALILLLIATPAAAAPHGPGCALSTRECARVAQELAIFDELDAEDARDFGPTMSPYARALALVDRKYGRINARLPQLPPTIAREVNRIITCRAADHLQAVDGTPNRHPECR